MVWVSVSCEGVALAKISLIGVGFLFCCDWQVAESGVLRGETVETHTDCKKAGCSGEAGKSGRRDSRQRVVFEYGQVMYAGRLE